MSTPHRDDLEALTQLLESRPIYATRIGFHVDSTDEERAFAEDLFEIGRKWDELRAARKDQP